MTADLLLAPARRALRPPERLSPGRWAERHLRLSPKVTNFPGPFRMDLTPYMGGVFDAFEDPRIETLYLCWGAQTAKTTCELVCLCSTIDQDPGSALWAMPTIDLARSFSQNRFQPLIDETPVLCEEKPADPDRYKTLEMQFKRAIVALVGGNSPSNLSSRPIRYLFADEIDKFPMLTGREGSALNLAIRRTASFWNRKIVLSSTPSLADGPIWRGLLAGDWREYWTPCPHCGEFQTLDFPNIRIPEGLRDEEEIRDVAWYECVYCDAHIVNAQKPAMLRAGQWRAKVEAETAYDWTPPAPGGRVASFHLPSWYSPWTPFGDVLARFIRAKPYPDQLHEIINSDLAEPWEERGEAATEDTLLAHRSEYNEGTLPSDARPIALIQTVDVQQDSLYYVVRAWGRFEESWLVAYGVLPDIGALDATLSRVYDGHPLNLCMIDAKFRSGQVYDWCRGGRGRLPYRGMERMAQPIRWTTLDRMPDGGPIPGGLRLLLADGAHFKSVLFHRMAIRRGDPGYWHLHADTGRDYARQMTAEVLVDRVDGFGRRIQRWKQIRPDNHYLDCEVEQLAAAAVLGIRYAQAIAPAQPAAAPPRREERPDPWKPTRLKP
ncbi:MAG TPA: terminase gpA endonuclease subunit [Phycisphaerae bacterium]|nr:terminase gpA endonuclease subunit [Phycisphaerae bacterium]